MSPNIGNAENGLSGSMPPSSPSDGFESSAMTRCYGRSAWWRPQSDLSDPRWRRRSRPRIYVRGARGGLGWCVADRLRQSTSVDVVVAAGDAPAEPSIGHFDTVVDVGLADHDLLGTPRRERHRRRRRTARRRRSCSAPDGLVVVSSAMVYGAIANNPIPLTEEAVLRPDPTFVYARQLASAEALVEEWRTARPGRAVAVLRPAIPLAADGTSSLARALTAGLGQRFGEADPGAQFVHHDDVGVGRRAGGRTPSSTASTTWRPTAASPAIGCGRSAAGASGCHCPTRSPICSGRCGGGSSAVRSRPGCARTRVTRGSSPTTSCAPRVGRRRCPTSRPTSRAPRPSGGRW